MSSVPASTSLHRKTTSSGIATTKGNVQVHQSYNNNNGGVSVQQLNREIPEENLLTLGTLRYGIRMSSSPRITERRSMSFPSSTGTNSTSSTNLSRIPSTVSSAQTSSVMQNGGSKEKDCCCIGSSSLPWMHHSHGEHHHQQFGGGGGGLSNNNNNVQMSRSTKLPMPASMNAAAGGVSSAKNRNVSQSGNYPPSPQTTQSSHLQTVAAAHHAHYLNHPHQHSSSLLTSSNREASPPTVCCYTSSNSQNILSNTFRGGNSNQSFSCSSSSGSNNNKNQNKSNLIRYSRTGGTQVVENARNCDSLKSAGSKIRVKSDPCLGGLSVNLVQINDKDVDDADGKNHHKLLLLNTKSVSGLSSLSTSTSTSSSPYVIGNSVSALKNRTSAAAATVLCKPTTTTTTPSTDYSNNFCVNNNSNNNKTKVNYSSKSRTLLGENTRNTTTTTSERLDNLNLLNCFTSKVAHHHRRRDSRSSSVCLDASSGSCASENSLNTSVISEDLSTDVSLSSSLRKSNSELSRKSSLTSRTNNDSLKSSADTKLKYVRNGNLIPTNNHKLPVPTTAAITSVKKPTDFQEFRPEINNSDTENKQIICANLNDHANNLNFIDCSSSGDVSLADDSHIIRPLPPHTTSASPQKRSFLHTIPTVSSSLLSLSNETPKICPNNNQTATNIDFNQKNQIKLKEFYEQKTLSAATDLHKFKSNSHNINQQHSHVRYKTIASEYPNIGWNPNENYPNNQIFYESVTNNNRKNVNTVDHQRSENSLKLINNNNVTNGSYLIDTQSNIKQVPATVPRNNNNSNKNLKYYQSQQINGVNNGTSLQLTTSQQDLQKQNLMMERRRTLDKLHRLGFGKRSASTEVKPSSKAEKLRELTELLKGSRGSSSSSQSVPASASIPIPPPLPPPLPPPVPLRNKRKPKSLQHFLRSQQSTDSDHSESISSLPPIDADPLISVSSPALEMHSSGTISPNSIPSPIIGSPDKQSLRPNSSTSNLETAQSLRSHDLYDNHASKSTNYLHDDEFLMKLTRPEARQIIGSYTQSTIPFRSASFSQADYQAYKYRQHKDKDKTSLDLESAKQGDRKSKVHFDIVSDSKLDHIDKGTDTNRYPEKSVINLSLGENGRLTETLSGEVEVATEATEVTSGSGSKRNSDIETIVEETLGKEHEEPSVMSSQDEQRPEISDFKIVQASEVELEPLIEEEAPLTPTLKSEEQKANTCVIPIPVYDSVVKEWSTTSPSEQWIQSGDIDLPKVDPTPETHSSELTKGMSFESKCCEIEADRILDVCQNPEGKIEEHVSIVEDLVSTETKDPLEIHESSIDLIKTDDIVNLRESQPDLGHIEVRKRHSNNDSVNYQISDSGPNSPLLSPTEEKRRIDKSKRRKGIYIQWPAIETTQDTSFDRTSSTGDATPPWQCSITPDVFESAAADLDISTPDLTKIKIVNEYDKDNKDELQLPELQKEELAKSNSDPTTPDLEKSALGFKGAVQRGSLTYQSSDERDDSLLSTHPLRQFKNLFIRGDSVSDNECDRTHERMSASPAPLSGDADLKRYSKRPLRGPYGQMLEAEMKKPSPKVHYEELLEELNRKVENLSPLRGRGISSLSFDESSIPHSHKAKYRKSNTLLPVPSHTRTASSPSQLLEITQRTPSPIPHTRTDTEKTNKKLSLDCHLPNLEAKPKRASSDTTDKHSKRSSSSASDKSDKHGRYSSRTPSERSFVLNTPETPKSPMPTPELLAELLKGSSEKLTTEQHQRSSRSSNAQSSHTQPPASGDYGCDLPPAIVKCLNVSDADQRIHVVIELYHTEQNYVESLQTIVMKYMNPLKAPENSGIIDANLVDEIFFMIPSILNIHERFLDELKRRFETWDPMQKVGDAFIEVFSHPSILETYTSFINNSPKAKNAIRNACSQRPQFARFLGANAREHKRKLTLDHLLITPVQKFPWYELIFARLIKHTDLEHPDQKSLQEASKLVHNILLHINCMEKEALENGHREATLKDLEGVIEGINDLVTPDRTFLLFDLVTMPFGQATRKERGFFLFSDLLVITSIKRRSGTIRKPVSCPVSVAITLDTHKYKLLTKIALDELEIVKSKDENVRRIMKEIEQLTEDCNKLQQISELTVSLRCQHQVLEDTIRDVQKDIQRQLNDRQSNDSQLSQLELTLNSPTGAQTMTVVFSKPEKRTQWEETFTETKQKLATSVEKHPTPEFISSVPIRKTRAGLQFTCASPTLGGQKDVWVCNSDGYVGQVCVLSLLPEPTVTSCNGVCNAKILCVASVPASIENQRNSQHSSSPAVSISIDDSTTQQLKNLQLDNKTQQSPEGTNDTSNVRLESSSSSDDSEGENSCDKSAANAPDPVIVPQHQQQDSLGSNYGTGDDSSENNHNQSTMWLGTEDGCIHVYNCTDNIRIKKNKIKIQHVTAVYSILYLDNRVFVSLANGDILVYTRDQNGWNTTTPLHISVGTVTEPVTKLLNVLGKLWCSIQGIIKILNTSSLHVENQIQISNDSKPITNMATLSSCVWISIQNSAHIKCFHSTSYELLFEVNLAPSVNKMLSNCDDIIRQHKAACLRVTSLLACKDLIWVGTSAGVLLTIPAQGLTQGSSIPPVTGIPHGHTGHVRFLTTVETTSLSDEKSNRLSMHGKIKPEINGKTLVISGGDGYEDFRSSGNNTMSEIAGREDSTNHLLLWEV